MAHRRLSWAAALLLALGAGGAAAEPARAGEPAGVAGIAPGVVDGETARRLVAAGVTVVDVRTPEEFATGHVPGAVNIPHDQMPARFSEIGPASTPVLMYCRSGRRTQIAADTLREQGFSSIYDMESYDKWVRSEPR